MCVCVCVCVFVCVCMHDGYIYNTYIFSPERMRKRLSVVRASTSSWPLLSLWGMPHVLTIRLISGSSKGRSLILSRSSEARRQQSCRCKRTCRHVHAVEKATLISEISLSVTAWRQKEWDFCEFADWSSETW